MILSMTGFGSAQHLDRGISYSVEVRSVNNRYLKLSVKLPELFQSAEAEIERLLRSRLSRGTVTYMLKARSESPESSVTINLDTMQQYIDRLMQVRLPANVQPHIDLAAIALLPGVADIAQTEDESHKEMIEVLSRLTNQALDALIGMRREEGRVLKADLYASLDGVRKEVIAIQSRAPGVIEEYHERLRNRVGTLMQKGGYELEAEGLMREVAIYAERCDIGEEINRLRSHLDQFVELCERGDQVGRTLDFLTQELLREANTIGSKSNDAVIARSVVTIKGLIDRLKEQVQNVE